MSEKRPRRAAAQAETRAELLRAASRLFLRNGFVATSLDNIADEAGVTKGAVYSNFASKEDLFLALLQEPGSVGERYAPSRVEPAGGMAPAESGERFGRYAAGVRPSRRHVALFLETNAAAVRSERARAVVGEQIRTFAADVGERLARAFGAPPDDAAALGLIAQSLYAGLLMHGAFVSEVDDALFAKAYTWLAAGAATAGRSDGTAG